MIIDLSKVKKKPFFKAELPLPPSVNHYWGKRVAGGRRKFVHVYLTSKAKKFRDAVVAKLRTKGVNKPFKGRFLAAVVIHPKTRRVTDIDNYGKGLFDALTYAGVYLDDSQMDLLYMERGEVIKGGKVSIELYEIAGNDSDS